MNPTKTLRPAPLLRTALALLLGACGGDEPGNREPPAEAPSSAAGEAAAPLIPAEAGFDRVNAVVKDPRIRRSTRPASPATSFHAATATSTPGSV